MHSLLKSLFTSKTRIKLLKLFLFSPDQEYFVRELSRLTEEQINGIRRELANFKKMGLLRLRSRDRKKYYVVNQEFLLFDELRSIFLKTTDHKEEIVDTLTRLGPIDFLLLTGVFTGAEDETPVDLFVVTDVDKEELIPVIEQLSPEGKELRYSIMNKDTFLYRLRFKDSFLLSLLRHKQNLVLINKLKRVMGS